MKMGRLLLYWFILVDGTCPRGINHMDGDGPEEGVEVDTSAITRSTVSRTIENEMRTCSRLLSK
jgi:hypothetical protein